MTQAMVDLFEPELSKQSKYHVETTTLVDDSETVIRYVFAPRHLNADGLLEEDSIPSEDLLYKKLRGCSVQREHLDEYEHYTNQRDSWLQKQPPQSLSKLAFLKTQDLRALVRDCGARAAMVVDDALQCNLAHAKIYAAPDITKSGAKKLRHQLVGMMNAAGLLDPEEYYTKKN